jgi:hypothetical protein
MTRVLSRRNFSLAAAGLLALATRKHSTAQSIYDSPDIANLLGPDCEHFQHSLDGLYTFLNAMSDAYASGTTIRLSQSYSDQGFAGFPYVAFTYDNAVAIMAYLARGRHEDIQRASILGQGLIHAQTTNFPVADGRFAQAYFVNLADASGAYVTPAAYPFYFYSSSSGDQAWAGMALAQIYQRTHSAAFLKAAVKVANWIVANTYDTQGPGGYRFGTYIDSSNHSQPSGNGKATEHNIDIFAFFSMLAKLTGNSTWSALAKHALTFVEAMFNSTGGFFYTGTTGDQITISKDIIPEDVQTWSYLALENKTYGMSLDWVKTNLVTIDTPSSPFSALTGLGNVRVQGETFDTASLATSGNDPEAVWLEGTAHTVSALLLRHKEADDADDSPFPSGDRETAKLLLKNLRFAQSLLGTSQTLNGAPLTPGQGIVAATGRLDTGFGYDYFANLHIGATGWYALALHDANPFRL